MANIPNVVTSLEKVFEASHSFSPRRLSAQTIENLRKFTPAGPNSENNVRLLQEGKALCVITGQQLGIFLGPLFTLYKAFSCVALAKTLEEHLQAPVVPIFWLQSEDHDYDEISRLQIFSPSNGIQSFALTRRGVETSRTSIKYFSFPEQGKALLDNILSSLRSDKHIQHLTQTERFQHLSTALQTSYTPGCSVVSAFTHLLHSILGDSGLLFFDPRESIVSPDETPIFSRALEDHSTIYTLLKNQSAELHTHGLADQVHIRANSPLFFVHFPNATGNRYRLELRKGTWVTVGGNYDISENELRSLLAGQPERFSSSALLRPILQDSIFPTLAYIGGESELRYHQQIAPLYSHWGIPQPLLISRMSAFVLDARARRLFQELQLEPSSFFDDHSKIYHELQSELPRTEELKHEFSARFLSLFENLEQRIIPANPDLSSVIRRGSDKAQRVLSGILSRYESALSHRETTQLRRFRALSAIAFPDGKPQERSISFLYYWLLFGSTFTDAIRTESFRWSKELTRKTRVLEVQ